MNFSSNPESSLNPAYSSLKLYQDIFRNRSSDIVNMRDLKISRQSGVVPLFRGKDGLQVVLVKTRRGGRWVFPKGNLCKGCTMLESAEKEAYEEAGVRGSSLPFQSRVYFYRKARTSKRFMVTMYPMKVRTILRKWPEFAFRERRFFSIEEACEVMDSKVFTDILRSFTMKKRIRG